MRERRAAGVAAFEFRFVQMHAVREHRAATNQAVMSVDIEIIAPLREQLHHPRNLIVLLSDMGLHESPGVLAPERACEFQLFRGAAPSVPWRNGVETAPSPVPLVDQRLRLVIAGASGICESGGCVAVHQDLPGNEPEVAPFRLRKKRVDRARMHRAKDECRRGPLPHQLVAEDPRSLLRDRWVSKGLLGDEGVVVEPVQQLAALRADNSGLNVVNVRVDEARRNQTARMVGNVGVGWQPGSQRTLGTDRLDDAVAADHKAIGLMYECRSGIGEKRIVAAKN